MKAASCGLSSHPFAISKMFFITESDYGQTFHAETFPTFDDACDALNAMEYAQDCAYSYTRELAISELKSQIQDFLEESTD
jgi:hypothetical protein